MLTFLILGAVGLALLVVSVLFDDILDVFDIGPDWISGISIGAFLAVFGCAGAITMANSDNLAVSTAVGFAAGAGLAAVAQFTTRALNKDSRGATYTSEELVGLEGVALLTAPNQDSIVPVSLTVAGQKITVNGRCPDTSLTSGQVVTVTRAVSPTQVIVSPIAQ